MANLVTSYETSHSHRLYNENDLATDAPMVNIDNLIKGKTFSVLGEVDYEKTWKNSRLTAGIRHTQSWIQNKYVEQNTNRSHESRQQTIFSANTGYASGTISMGRSDSDTASITMRHKTGSPTPTPFGVPGSRPDIPSTTIPPYDSTLSAWAA